MGCKNRGPLVYSLLACPFDGENVGVRKIDAAALEGVPPRREKPDRRSLPGGAVDDGQAVRGEAGGADRAAAKGQRRETRKCRATGPSSEEETDDEREPGDGARRESQRKPPQPPWTRRRDDRRRSR